MSPSNYLTISDMVLQASHVNKTKTAINAILERTGKYIAESNSEPISGSIFQRDISSSTRPESISSAVSIGDLALEFSSDHLSCFTKIITEPIETLACFTCIRSMLETTAIGAWVLDPTISSSDRIARVFAIRFDALDQQLKLTRCVGGPAQEIMRIDARLLAVEREAMGLGYKSFRNKKNAIYAIGTLMPGATDMIREVLGDEWMYRLLSAVAHGHHWAIVQLGFQNVTARVGETKVAGVSMSSHEKHVNVDGIVLLGWHGIHAFSRLIWNKAQYHAWDLLKLEQVLEEAADEMSVADDVRFWRS